MIIDFNQFKLNEELKNYPLYKGVKSSVMYSILKDNKIKSSLYYKDEVDVDFDSSIREIVAGKNPIISASRSFETAKSYGKSGCVFEFDMLKLSSRYRILPFCENPDFYLDYFKKNKSRDRKDKLKDMLRDKDFGDLYWKIKTEPSHYDYGICEELIIAKHIDITKYVKKIHTNERNISVFDSLNNKHGIEIVPFK